MGGVLEGYGGGVGGGWEFFFVRWGVCGGAEGSERGGLVCLLVGGGARAKLGHWRVGGSWGPASTTPFTGTYTPINCSTRDRSATRSLQL